MIRLELNRCVIGDALKELRKIPDETFHCCVTSPPYWGLRDYQVRGQYGLERTPQLYVRKMVALFREVRRVLRDDGTLWLNIGDSYAASPGGGQGKNGSVVDRAASRLGVREQKIDKVVAGLKPKDLVGIPWLLAFALRADGWWLRSEIIWHKPSPMPESVTDRPTKAHEQVFLLAKSERYAFDAAAIRDLASGVAQEHRNARTVWTIPSEPYAGAHFAAMPSALAQRCMLAGAPVGGAVLDPFFGSGTVGEVAEVLGRRWFGIELNGDYAPLIAKRTAQKGMVFAEPQELAEVAP